MSNENNLLQGFLEYLVKDAHCAQSCDVTLNEFIEMHSSSLSNIFNMVKNEGLEYTLHSLGELANYVAAADDDDDSDVQTSFKFIH